MAPTRALQALLLAGYCLAAASAQTLYQRPSNFSRDCLPATTTATTFAAIFPSDFFLTGGQVSEQDQSTKVRDDGVAPEPCVPRRRFEWPLCIVIVESHLCTFRAPPFVPTGSPLRSSHACSSAQCSVAPQITIARNFEVEYFPSYKVSAANCCNAKDCNVSVRCPC